MRVHQQIITVRTSSRGPVDLTERVRAAVAESGVETGLCTVFVQHTSAGLVIQENADPTVLSDLGRWLADLAPESSKWAHGLEGPDDMPGHLRSVLTRSSEAVPVRAGRLALGTWQALYLWEHRAAPHTRTIIVHVAGAELGEIPSL